MLDENIYEFEYQNYWRRALSLLPLIFFAPLILSFFWQKTNQGLIQFYVVSIVITFVIAYTLYRHIELPFRHEGTMRFDEEHMCFMSGSLCWTRKRIHLMEIVIYHLMT